MPDLTSFLRFGAKRNGSCELGTNGCQPGSPIWWTVISREDFRPIVSHNADLRQLIPSIHKFRTGAGSSAAGFSGRDMPRIEYGQTPAAYSATSMRFPSGSRK